MARVEQFSQLGLCRDCGGPSDRGRCDDCRRAARRAIEAAPGRRARKLRLYGRGHRNERASWAPLVDSQLTRCWRCGDLIDELGDDGRVVFDLGHTDDGVQLPEHWSCNRSTGGREKR